MWSNNTVNHCKNARKMKNAHKLLSDKDIMGVYLSIDGQGPDNTNRNRNIANYDFAICTEYLHHVKRKMRSRYV